RTQAAAANPTGFYVAAFEKIAGNGVSGVMVILLCASLILSMNTATADGSRALYGIAKDGMTIGQLHFLSKHHIPSRAMTLDRLLNGLLLLFVGSTLSIPAPGSSGPGPERHGAGGCRPVPARARRGQRQVPAAAVRAGHRPGRGAAGRADAGRLDRPAAARPGGHGHQGCTP